MRIRCGEGATRWVDGEVEEPIDTLRAMLNVTTGKRPGRVSTRPRKLYTWNIVRPPKQKTIGAALQICPGNTCPGHKCGTWIRALVYDNSSITIFLGLLGTGS